MNDATARNLTDDEFLAYHSFSDDPLLRRALSRIEQLVVEKADLAQQITALESANDDLTDQADRSAALEVSLDEEKSHNHELACENNQLSDRINVLTVELSTAKTHGRATAASLDEASAYAERLKTRLSDCAKQNHTNLRRSA